MKLSADVAKSAAEAAVMAFRAALEVFTALNATAYAEIRSIIWKRRWPCWSGCGVRETT